MRSRSPADPRRAFGAAVREKRRSTGVSQEALADACGLHRTYIGGIERGERNVSLVNMAKLADALGVKLSQLVGAMEEHFPGVADGKTR